ncbi:energy transducer TonB [Glaciecola sp. MH2013]|uniref:energy transducer TonB n=1 Tax=Glaciecola sp. MH2013 TaxID=2785524 RepID=UPI00189C7B07|nr:energy transducer TonB [Glaciecola sp. MH2013]MBF7074775.1 energy transducer TonB [Glaciecola sp. MH2013]
MKIHKTAASQLHTSAISSATRHPLLNSQDASNNAFSLPKFLRLSGSVLIGGVATFAIFVMMHKLIQSDAETQVFPPVVALDSIVYEEKETDVRKITRVKPKPPVIKAPKVDRVVPPVEIDPGIGEISDWVFEAPQDTIGNTFDSSMLDGDTRPLVRFPANYPAEAARQGIQGWVELGFSIDEKGEVVDIQILNAEPKRIFDREAKRALKRWKYKPKIVNGQAVMQTGLSVMLDFTLDE